VTRIAGTNLAFAAVALPDCAIFVGGLGMGTTARFEAVMAALLARDNVYLSGPEQKAMAQAEFLHGAATAFAVCWRGEESSQCSEAARGLLDQLAST
jgi:hypothetical protein